MVCRDFLNGARALFRNGRPIVRDRYRKAPRSRLPDNRTKMADPCSQAEKRA